MASLAHSSEAASSDFPASSTVVAGQAAGWPTVQKPRCRRWLSADSALAAGPFAVGHTSEVAAWRRVRSSHIERCNNRRSSNLVGNKRNPMNRKLDIPNRHNRPSKCHNHRHTRRTRLSHKNSSGMNWNTDGGVGRHNDVGDQRRPDRRVTSRGTMQLPKRQPKSIA